jgi:hypothetical protein
LSGDLRSSKKNKETTLIPIGPTELEEVQAKHIVELEGLLEDVVMAADLPGNHCEIEQAVRRAREALETAKR